MKLILRSLLVACWVLLVLSAPGRAFQGANPQPEITPYDLIGAMNSARVANGLPALIVSDILMGTAQGTAEIMAANNIGGHIGDVKGRVMAAGYGGGQDAWATENIMTGPTSLQGIMQAWSDDLHMIPARSANYCHIGAGVAVRGGVAYYVLHAAYTSAQACGASVVAPPQNALTPVTPPTSDISQWILPVEVATPSADGFLIHIVKSGQSLWNLAEAYGVTIEEIMNMNYYISPDNQEIYIGQKVYIPTLPVTLTPTAAPYTVTPPSAKKFTPTPTLRSFRPVSALNTSIAPAAVSPQGSPFETDEDALNKGISLAILAVLVLGGALVVWGVFSNRSR